MKKIALILCIIMLFSVVACANNNNPGTTTPPGNNTTPGTTAPGTPGTNGTNGTDNTNNNNVNTNGNGNIAGNQTLTGTAQGYGGEVKVTVEVNGDDIVKVNVVGEKETQGVGSNAIDQLPAKIEEADSTDVEVVSGATFTSNAIKEAVDKALEGIKK